MCIYEMLFSFPNVLVGLFKLCDPGPERGLTKLYVTKREHHDEEHCEGTGCFRTQPLQRILAILSTNKQIYHEAVPLFYQINHFKAETARELSVWVESVAPSRLQHVRHMSFRYAVRTRPHFGRLEAALLALSSLQNLKSLEIDAEDPQCFAPFNHGRRIPHPPGKYSGPCHLPGMEELVNLVRVAETLTITGDFPRIKEYLLDKVSETSSKTECVGTVRAQIGSRARRQRMRLQRERIRQASSKN